MSIQIYDRYGKLIATLKGISEGWDGTLNGNELPSSDYWFVVKRESGKVFKGHFTLKR
jgi:gliding motility-associated-like protein